MMSLFPAYSQEDLDAQDEYMRTDSEDLEHDEQLSPGAESALLAEPPPPPAPRAPPPREDFYLDRKLDRANLRLSTLYYPARPEYRPQGTAALGTSGVGRAARAAGGKTGGKKERSRRYWRRGAMSGVDSGADGDEAGERAARTAAFRRALLDTPQDEELWLRYIDFLEWSGSGAEAEVAAAAAGAARLRRSAALRERLHAALRRALPPADLAARLAHMRADERSGVARAELWAREVSALLCAGALEAARERAGAAAADRAAARHHHIVLLAFGCGLRCAGLWEQLSQLVELLAAMNYPPSARFPPARCPRRAAAAELQLAAWERRAAASGLPGAAVWARVERARAQLHWRALPADADPLELAADPQRAPPPAALAPLLAPAPGELRLLAALLQLAETPLLPAAGYVRRAAGGALPADWAAATAAHLPALLRAARRLPPAHPARPAPAHARLLLQYTPLRDVPATQAADTSGFGAWRRALWAAALQWAAGAARAALLCWRLRELHARVLLTDNEEDIRAIRNEARELLREWAGADALPFCVFARVEAAAGGGGRAALRAARHALAAHVDHDSAAHAHTALYAARVVWEVCGARAGEHALCCAAARRPLPPDAQLHAEPPAPLRDHALTQCSARCAELEQQYAGEQAEAEAEGESAEAGERALLAALLPGAAEWAAARALLAPPAARAALAAALQRTAAWPGAGGARYREQCACALAAAAAAEHAAAATARALRHLAPGNMYLALLSAGSAPWEGDAARDEPAAWAALLPALLRAAAAGWPSAEGRRACGALWRARRAAGAGGGGLLLALRLDAAPDPRAPLTHALAHAPLCKWVLVRGAALGAGDARELAELALERALRLHALPDELEPGAEGGAAGDHTLCT